VCFVYLRVLLGTTATVTSFPLSRHTGGHPPSLAILFTDHVRSAPSLLSSRTLLTTLLQAFLLQVCWKGAAAPTFSTQLVYLQFCEGLPLPPPSELKAPCPLCYMSFCYCYYSVSLFSLGGGQSVQEAMLIWPRVVCGSTTCCLAHLVLCFSQAG
jgi:hypothetical protein